MGWQRRWTRMTREDEITMAEAVAKRYDEVLIESEKLSPELRRDFIFEQMRQFRLKYREWFLRTRGE
jgi:hypothetical protein